MSFYPPPVKHAPGMFQDRPGDDPTCVGSKLSGTEAGQTRFSGARRR
jgi:hypothetical protein